MTGGTTPATDPNKNLYNGGSEWQNDFGDLPDLMQTYYRNYDQALGRWTGVDPDAEGAESLTTYNYSGNNPVMFNDPLGDKNELPTLDEILAKWAKAGVKTITYDESNIPDYLAGGAGGATPNPGGASPYTFIKGNQLPLVTIHGDRIPLSQERKNREAQVNGIQVNLWDGLSQIANLGAVTWGSAEIGLHAIRNFANGQGLNYTWKCIFLVWFN